MHVVNVYRQLIIIILKWIIEFKQYAVLYRICSITTYTYHHTLFMYACMFIHMYNCYICIYYVGLFDWSLYIYVVSHDATALELETRVNDELDRRG